MVARLITIPISHFCEKARWALDRAGVPYREERHLQGIHIVAARRAGGARTVPVLVPPAAWTRCSTTWPRVWPTAGRSCSASASARRT